MNEIKKYAPNSVRWEVDDDVAYRTIYINDEFVEMCPIGWTKEQAEARLDKLIFDMKDGKREISDEDEYFDLPF